MKLPRALFPFPAVAALGMLLASAPATAQDTAEGYAISNDAVIDNCSSCHRVDDEGRMSRISFLRKTPEGWQTSIRRMVALHGASLSQNDARDIARYLANEQGLAPEELRPGLFEVERRVTLHDYEGDSGVEFTCIQCHTMGRVITQRRPKEEWALLLTTHRALYPLVDGQAFRNRDRGGGGDDGINQAHPMDVAIDHLSEVFPLETPEWSAWAATKRAPRLTGTWALSGHEPGRGPIHGTVTIVADRDDAEVFTSSADYVYAESGERVRRTGEALVYTGYQWRGRSNPGSADELREVMFVERDQQSMTGRWFRGDYDEFGPDVTLRRVSASVVTGIHPRAVQRGTPVDVTIYGSGLAAASAPDLDFGAGVTVTNVRGPANSALTVRLNIAEEALVGGRDLFAYGSLVEDALVVHDGVDRIEVTPQAGMARTGGAAFPKAYQVFEALGFDDGPDGEPDTEDDLALGRVEVSWGMEEYAAIFGDDDIEYVGTINQDGTVIPAEDGPNPNRPGLQNNIGDVWVVATHARSEMEPLTARAHLIVTVPLYMRWEPWRPIDAPPPVSQEDR
jgi:quinohemoprotein amine dehydrogenase